MINVNKLMIDIRIHCTILEIYSQSSDYGIKVTPVPIPNTKVKL